MNLRKWWRVVLMLALVVALSSLSAQADPYPPYRHHGYGYDWDGPRHHGFDRYDRHSWRSCKWGHHPHYMERVYSGPQVAYVAPVAPMIGIPYSQPQPQPYFAKPGLSGTLQYNF